MESHDLQGAHLKRALLERLRFEQSMGIDVVRPVAFERSAATTAPSPAPAPRPAPVQTHASLIEETPAVEALAEKSASPVDKEQRWKELEARAMGCTQCVLHRGRTKVVFGVGNRSAELVFVGEGPGADEDRQGEPFVGRAGQLLNKIMTAMKWNREDVYICNVVKCRPPENRTPLPDEVAACNPFLVEQIELISPKAIVALGAPAAKTLLKTTQGIMSLRGKWHTYRGIPVMPTYHPAFLLRSYTEENRRAVWEDMKQVVERLKQ
jgi:DNA polymerase